VFAWVGVGRSFLGLRGLWYASEAENVGKSGEIPGLCRNCNAGFDQNLCESECLFLALCRVCHFLRCTGATVMIEITCPGLFCPTIASDGVLTRIRIPGGQVSIDQLLVLTQVMGRLGCLDLLITNRANVQVRSAQAMTPLDLAALQEAGLAAKNPAIDHLRNIMASPMAGLEPDAFDVMPALVSLEKYICETLDLAQLSAKFSIGLDGGERASVRDRANDVWLIANDAGFELVLSLGDGEEWWTGLVGDAVSLVKRVADRYLVCLDQYERQSSKFKHSQKHRRSRKPRLRDIIALVGKAGFLEEGAGSAARTGNLDKLGAGLAGLAENSLLHLQAEADRIAIEIICPLGKLALDQINGLIWILKQFDLSQIRLTPWQTLIIPNVLRSDLPNFKKALMQIPLNPNANHPARGIVACTGKSGCQSAATHAQEHAQQLIARLERLEARSFPTIQISGCEKLCAMPRGSEITLVGCEVNGEERYGDWLPGEAIDRVIQQIQLVNSG
jgi:ferredoxin-nitrite reductase